MDLHPGNTNAVDMLSQMGEVVKAGDIVVDESILQSYVGIYRLLPGFNIEITRDGYQLFGQTTGQNKFEIFAKSPTECYQKIVEARIVFSTSPEGIVSLTFYQNGQALPGRKI